MSVIAVESCNQSWCWQIAQTHMLTPKTFELVLSRPTGQSFFQPCMDAVFKKLLKIVTGRTHVSLEPCQIVFLLRSLGVCSQLKIETRGNMKIILDCLLLDGDDSNTSACCVWVCESCVCWLLFIKKSYLLQSSPSTSLRGPKIWFFLSVTVSSYETSLCLGFLWMSRLSFLVCSTARGQIDNR